MLQTSSSAHRIELSIAEINFTITASNTQRIKRLLPSYAPFQRKKNIAEKLPATKESAVEVEVKDDFSCDEGLFSPVHEFFSMDIRQEVFQNETGDLLFKLYTADGAHVTTLVAPKIYDHFEIGLYGSDAGQSFGLNNAMMLIFTLAGAARQTLLIHSSTVRCKGRAFSFLGTSGTGKSTHSDLWVKHIPEASILNDDNPALKVMPDNTIRVYGTPWSGKRNYYINESYPLAAIVRLHQAPKNEISKLQPIMGFVELWASCSKLIWDRDFSNQIRSLVEVICTKVNSFSLNCLPDAAAAQLCHDTVTAHFEK